MSSKAIAPFLLTDEGIDDVLADCGLCCPDDPLDDVMGCYLPVLDDGFMAALGMGGPPCPGADRRRDELKKDAPPALAAPVGGVPEVEDFDVDMFFADGAPPNYAPYQAAVPLAAHVASDGVAPVQAPPLPTHDVPDGAVVAPYRASQPPAYDVFDGAAPLFAPLPLPASVPALHGAIVPYSAPSPLPQLACDALDGVAPVSAPPLLTSHDALYGSVVPCRAPPLPAHDDASPAVPPPTTTSSTSSGCCASSMTTWWEPDSPLRVRSLPLLPACSWAVPRKKRTRHITRQNHFWLPKARLHPAAPPPPRAATPPATSGIKPGHSKRPAVARQRNRERQRACSHCSNTETPQWRAGPRGPGTLCNACGIRYKQNGKLFEEYRPSTSPSFESGKHSNRHRKVVKLMERKQALLKMMAGGDAAPEPVPPPSGGGNKFMDVCTYISTG